MSVFDLRQGFGTLAWWNTKEDVDRNHRDVTYTRERRGVSPITGEEIVKPAGLLIRKFLAVESVPGAWLSAHVAFGKTGITEISLRPDDTGDATPRVLSALGALLGIEVALDEMDQAWEREGVKIVLYNEGHGFSLRLERRET